MTHPTGHLLAPLLGMPQGLEWLIILAVVVLIFGAAKLPELARGTGQALRIFKSETKGLRDDDDTSTPPVAAPPVELVDDPASPDLASPDLAAHREREPDARRG